MKLLKTCPILICIAAIAIVLSVTSYALEDEVYSDYAADYQPDKAPHFIMVFKGMTDGVYPWDKVGYPSGSEGDALSFQSETPDMSDHMDYSDESSVSGKDSATADSDNKENDGGREARHQHAACSRQTDEDTIVDEGGKACQWNKPGPIGERMGCRHNLRIIGEQTEQKTSTKNIGSCEHQCQ